MNKIDLSKLDTKILSEELNRRKKLKIEQITKQFNDLIEECVNLGIAIENESDGDYCFVKQSFSFEDGKILYNEVENY